MNFLKSLNHAKDLKITFKIEQKMNKNCFAVRMEWVNLKRQDKGNQSFHRACTQTSWNMHCQQTDDELTDAEGTRGRSVVGVVVIVAWIVRIVIVRGVCHAKMLHFPLRDYISWLPLGIVSFFSPKHIQAWFRQHPHYPHLLTNRRIAIMCYPWTFS